jgi:hypothetical protein
VAVGGIVIATSVAYDLVFIIHIMAAVTTIIVFVTMRFAAMGVARGADATAQSVRFPERRNWAARAIHVLPVTGVIMSISGGSSVSFARAWVGAGIILYLAAAGHLEARTLPEERVVASTIARDGVASRAQGRHLVGSIDVLLVLVAAALVTMLVQY